MKKINIVLFFIFILLNIKCSKSIILDEAIDKKIDTCYYNLTRQIDTLDTNKDSIIVDSIPITFDINIDDWK